jgi:hypothetical protein
MVNTAAQRRMNMDKIAKEVLGIETLNTRNSDDLDFYNLSVWQIKEALEAAYEAGRQVSS